MGLRPGRCYRNKGHVQRANTRVAIRRPRKNYLGAAPGLRIRQFNMGNPTKKYSAIVDLISKEKVEVRDNSIESIRMTINRNLVKELGKDGFFMKIRVFPSNILRENKQAQGAGADRVSQGMSQSFGAAVGRSARVREGKVLLSILCPKEKTKEVKDILSKINSKITCRTKVKIHDDIKSIGTLPRKKIKEVKAAAVVKETTEEKGKEKTEEGKESSEDGKDKTEDKETKKEDTKEKK